MNVTTEQTAKTYKCSQCGAESKQVTNHFGVTYSFGHYNCCPNCPPYKKYPEMGGLTIWECQDKE